MSIFSNVGGLVNDLLGGTSSAKQQQQYSTALAGLNNMYNKETMQNLHQWEIQDLQKAGLNPILSTGGNTSGISTAAPTGANPGTRGNPLEMIATAINYGQQLLDMDKTSAEKTNLEANTSKLDAETQGIQTTNANLDQQQKAEIGDLNASAALNSAKAGNVQAEKKLIEANTEKAKSEKKFNDERARGFSETTSNSIGANANILGMGHGNQTAKAVSRTW